MYNLSRSSINGKNEAKQVKNRCQRSIILENYHSSDKTETKEHFLTRAERSIYEGEPMSDDEVEAECRLWAQTLPHLRICGKSIRKIHSDEMQEGVTVEVKQNFSYDPGKKLQTNASVKRLSKKKVEERKHFTLPSIFNSHHTQLSRPSNICSKQ